MAKKKSGFGFKKKKTKATLATLPKKKDHNFAKGGSAKGTGKSTALTGKKAVSAKARARKEAYMKGEQLMDESEIARRKKANEDKKALAEARKKLMGKKK